MARLICVIFGTLQKCSALNTSVSFIQGRRHGYKVGTAKLSRRRIRQKKGLAVPHSEGVRQLPCCPYVPTAPPMGLFIKPPPPQSGA